MSGRRTARAAEGILVALASEFWGLGCPRIFNEVATRLSIHIVINEEECQHLFSLYSIFDDAQFLQSTINSLDFIKSSINGYQNTFSGLIAEAKKKQHRIVLSYSATQNTRIIKQEEPFAKINPLLTKREQECLSYLLKGFNIKQIAKKLLVSPRTIEFHIHNIKLKSQCKTKSQLVEIFS